MDTKTSTRVMISQQRTITIFQWNMLADYQSDGFKNTDAKNTTWEHRKPLIMDILKQSGADIICLQECDKFDELFQELKEEYYGNFVKKIGSDQKDGVAIFVRRSKIKIEATEPVRLNKKMSQVALIHLLNINGFRFLLVATHLKSSEFESGVDPIKFEVIRGDQVNEICYALKEKFQAFGTFTSIDDHPLFPLIVTGDMNAERNGLCMRWWYDVGLESAYQNIKDCYTTYKKRDKKIKCIEEDYILFSKRHFKVVEILSLPPKTEFLPNANYPSDHIFLMTKLCY